MRPVRPFVHSIVLCILVAGLSPTYGSVAAQTAADASRSVGGGGIYMPGWQGKVDSNAQGLTVNDARLAPEAGGIHVTTGPAITYWDPANKATGDYTVSATFTEPKFMNLNTHAHPYGIFIGGNGLGTANASLLYCAAYGNGNFIVRGFGPEPFQMNGRRGETNNAVNKAAGPGETVKQIIAMSVKGDKVTCSVNGTVVATYNKSDVVGPGKLTSTDGVYGIRFAHNTEGIVSDLKTTKP